MPEDVHYEEEVVSDGSRMTHATERHRAVSPGRVLGGIVGLVLSIIGVVAIAKAGIDGSLDQPVVSVLGMDQSAIVGLVFFAIGLLIILGAASEATRSLMGVMGVVALIAGVLAAASTESVRADIGMGKGAGWFLAVCGALTLAASLIGTYVYGRREVQVMPGSPRWHH